MSVPIVKNHPWVKWFSRSAFTLTKGKEFEGQVHSMISQVRSAAKKQRLKVSIRVIDETINVTVKRSHAAASRAAKKAS